MLNFKKPAVIDVKSRLLLESLELNLGLFSDLFFVQFSSVFIKILTFLHHQEHISTKTLVHNLKLTNPILKNNPHRSVNNMGMVCESIKNVSDEMHENLI